MYLDDLVLMVYMKNVLVIVTLWEYAIRCGLSCNVKCFLRLPKDAFDQFTCTLHPLVSFSDPLFLIALQNVSLIMCIVSTKPHVCLHFECRYLCFPIAMIVSMYLSYPHRKNIFISYYNEPYIDLRDRL